MKLLVFVRLTFCVFILAFLGQPGSVMAQFEKNAPVPNQALEKLPYAQLPTIQNEYYAELAREENKKGKPLRFAEPIPVHFTPENAGSWEESDSLAEWKLRIRSKGAYSINIGFFDFHLPPDALLTIYSIDQKHIVGPLSVSNNEQHESYWSPIVPSDDIIVELQVPKHQKDKVRLSVDRINHDFLDFANQVQQLGICDVDVSCGAADNYPIINQYRDQINSVGLYSVNGSLACSGFLVSNTQRDCKPYFMSAYHCNVTAENAPSVVVYWKYENTTCREVNTNENSLRGNGRFSTFNSGAILRASYMPTDMVLLELDDPVPAEATPFYAGWDRRNILPTGGVVTIHHPAGMEKRISYSSKPLNLSSWLANGRFVENGDHLSVPRWDWGSTTFNSSGGPLFNAQGLAIGQLHGGDASCTVYAQDLFGRFHSSWEGGGRPDNRLKDWLDPLNRSVTTLTGSTPTSCAFAIRTEKLNIQICKPGETTIPITLNWANANAVALDVQGEIAGTQTTLSNDILFNGQQTMLKISAGQNAEPGDYILTVLADDGFQNTRLTIPYSIVKSPPVTAPTEGYESQKSYDRFYQFNWKGSPTALSYEWELCTSLTCETPYKVFSSTNADTLYKLQEVLPKDTPFFWRVRALNQCGKSNWSSVYSFKTPAITCQLVEVNNSQLQISPERSDSIKSTVWLNGTGIIESIALEKLQIRHGFVGDLKALLTHPSGKSIVLFDRIGPDTYGCKEKDISIQLDDAATKGYAELDQTCLSGQTYAVSGIYKPQEAFSAFTDLPSQGFWTLTIIDDFEDDGGYLENWTLRVCEKNTPGDYINSLQSNIVVCTDTTTLWLKAGNFTDKPSVQLSASVSAPSLTVQMPNSIEKNGLIPVFISNIAPGSHNTVTVTAIGYEDISFTFTIDRPANRINTPRLRIAGRPNASVSGTALRLTWDDDNAIKLSDTWYEVELWITANPLQTVFTRRTQDLFTDVTGLSWNTNYSWKVRSFTPCGTSDWATATFETAGENKLLTIQPVKEVFCPNTPVVFSILTGGIDNKSDFSVSVSGASGEVSGIRFQTLPETLSANTETIVQITNTDRLNSGSYKLIATFENSLQTVSDTAFFTVSSSPPAVQLVPLGISLNTAFSTQTTRFKWLPLSGGKSVLYRFQLSSDPTWSGSSLYDYTTWETSASVFIPQYYSGNEPLFWRVQAWDDCGWSQAFQSQPVIASVSSTSFNHAKAGNWLVYPNPSSTTFFVQYAGEETEDVTLGLYTLQGSEVSMQKSVFSNGKSLSVISQGLSAGVYVLRIRNTRNEIVYKKVIIQ